MNAFEWYERLNKPSWAPSASIFGPVWTFLYILIIVSYGYVFYQFIKGNISFLILLPFILNLFFNLIFSPIQFGLQKNILALIDVLLVFFTLVWAIITIYPFYSWVAYINLPYLLWITIATTLQTSVTYLNRSVHLKANLKRHT